MADSTPLQQIRADLEEDRRDLLDAVESVPADERNRRQDPDRWSVAEILEHLGVIEGRVVTMMTGFIATAPARSGNSPATAGARHRDLLLDRTRQIKAPAPIEPTGDVDSDAAWRVLEDTRDRLLDVLRAAEDRDLTQVSRPHPVLGLLNGYEWLESLGGHEARHAAQIREIADELR